jgi:hypothetical protein
VKPPVLLKKPVKNTSLCTKAGAVNTAISTLLENIQDEKHQPKLID